MGRFLNFSEEISLSQFKAGNRRSIRTQWLIYDCCYGPPSDHSASHNYRHTSVFVQDICKNCIALLSGRNMGVQHVIYMCDHLFPASSYISSSDGLTEDADWTHLIQDELKLQFHTLYQQVLLFAWVISFSLKFSIYFPVSFVLIVL